MLTLEQIQKTITDRSQEIQGIFDFLSKSLENAYNEVVTLLGQRDALKVEIQNLGDRKYEASKQLVVLETKRDNAEAEHNKLLEEYGAQIIQLRNNTARAKRDFETATGEREAFESETQNLRDELVRWENELKTKTAAFKKEKQDFYAEQKRKQREWERTV